MDSKKTQKTSTTTLPFEQFWTWLQRHANCIVRAGTPDSMVYDDEDLHWHLAVEDEETLLVQVFRGKRVMAEIFLHPADVAYVQVEQRDAEEFIFELISEDERERVASWQFTLSHGYEDDDEEPSGSRGWTH